ncbi:MAG: hypothetical protein OEZ01_17495 [Candidatus Heimdallarchaeota archaeon]|nr:hypothetical protein [Candidatus Heimdallarchaeota archaeon]MDH5647810.1 hypothetical protein [Candidatus Heimdallarchaeota archaeon]
MRKFLIIALTVIIMLNFASVPSYADPIYSPVPEDLKRPALQIQKWVDADEIEINDEMTVHVNISNWSAYVAYNLTIEEPSFNNYTITSVKGFDRYQWVEFGQNVSVYYNYTFTYEFSGNFSIAPTAIDFVDVNGTKYYAISSSIPVFVYIREPPAPATLVWRDLFLLSTAMLLIPIAVLLMNKYVWRK